MQLLRLKVNIVFVTGSGPTQPIDRSRSALQTMSRYQPIPYDTSRSEPNQIAFADTLEGNDSGWYVAPIHLDPKVQVSAD